MAKQIRPKPKKKRRRRKRGGRFGVILVLLCLILAVAGVITAMTVFFKIEQVTVSGDSRYSQEEIVAASGLETGDNLILFNKFRTINRIFDACPYLDEITMRRHLPDMVSITVTECVPVAALQTETGSWLMDLNGKLLEQVNDPAACGVTQITGVELTKPEVGKYAVFSDEDVKKPLFLLLNTLKNDGILPDIGEMDFTQQYDIQFSYTQRFTVRIGSTDDLEQKLRYLHLIVEEKLEANAAGTIDISDTKTARFVPNK